MADFLGYRDSFCWESNEIDQNVNFHNLNIAIKLARDNDDSVFSPTNFFDDQHECGKFFKFFSRAIFKNAFNPFML